MHSLIEIDPQKAGMDGSLLSKAIDFAIENESSMDRNIGAALDKGHFEEPWPIGKTIGPVKSRTVWFRRNPSQWSTCQNLG
jgi:hypothetical protein